MPKRRKSSSPNRMPLLLGVLAALALILFLGGELFAYLGSDTGRVALYRRLHVGDRAQVTRIIGKHLHVALSAAGVPSSVVTEDAAGGAGPALRWHIALTREGAPMQVNYALTRALEDVGAEVLSGRESLGEDGAVTVTLMAGVPGRPTHELQITRPGRPAEAEAKRLARVALVLEGLGEDAEATRAVLGLALPLAVLVPAIGDGHEALLRQARAAHHEIVLAIPMEPENYPRVNPGAGTLLVSSPKSRIVSETRHFVREGGDVVAVANLLGSFATQDEPFITAFYSVLKDAGLTFLHIDAVPRAVCKPLASQLGVAYDEPDHELEAETRGHKPDALARSWKQVLAYAQRHGHAIVLVRVTPMSATWLKSALTEKGLEGAQLVPLSSLLHHPTRL